MGELGNGARTPATTTHALTATGSEASHRRALFTMQLLYYEVGHR